MFKKPRDDDKYQWTTHAWEKMQHYQLPESRIKRIVRFPKRLEESIVPGTISVMQPSSPSWKQEIWVMYKLVKANNAKKPSPLEMASALHASNGSASWRSGLFLTGRAKRIKIITVWRYPGKSPTRDPIPEDVLAEIQQLL